MRRIVLDTNCLLMSIPKISPYRPLWDGFLTGKLTLCVSNEVIEEYLEIISQKTWLIFLFLRFMYFVSKNICVCF